MLGHTGEALPSMELEEPSKVGLTSSPDPSKRGGQGALSGALRTNGKHKAFWQNMQSSLPRMTLAWDEPPSWSIRLLWRKGLGPLRNAIGECHQGSPFRKWLMLEIYDCPIDPGPVWLCWLGKRMASFVFASIWGSWTPWWLRMPTASQEFSTPLIVYRELFGLPCWTWRMDIGRWSLRRPIRL